MSLIGHFRNHRLIESTGFLCLRLLYEYLHWWCLCEMFCQSYILFSNAVPNAFFVFIKALSGKSILLEQ
jgi:hypothetical protein